jgi:HlyD family secretion protein
MKSYLQLFLLLSTALAFNACGKSEAKTEEKTTEAIEKTPLTNDQVFGVARIEPEDGITDLVAGTDGKILSVLIDDNQDIQKGQAMLLVDQAVESKQLDQAKSKLNPQEATIAVRRNSLDVYKTQLANARENLQRNQNLYQGNAATKQALDDSRHEVERLEKEVQRAEAEIKEASSRLGELQADIQYYQTVLGQKKVLAPLAGKILKVNVKAGEYAQNDLKIAEFAPAGALVAKTEVDEIFAEKIKIGQQAVILSQTSGDTIARGKVYFAADYLKAKSLFKDQSTEQEDRRIREVHIKLESGERPLIGSRVDCIIYLK